MTKEDARIIQKKRILEIDNRILKETKINQKLLTRLSSCKRVIGYKSDKWEVDLDWVWFHPSLKNIQFYFPRVLSKEEKIMEFIFPEKWEKGAYGLMEPVGKSKISPIDIDIAIIPSLGFNDKGYRLGRGAGFYDRSFMGIEPKKMIGISFSELFSIDFPYSHYDIRVGELVTDTNVLFF
jgi:5-formyltetrahydrofolate cyclo-ligase